MAAAVLPATTTVAGREFSVVPNQTVYSIDASSRDEALALSAILNSTVVDARCLDIAERAKDDHFRFLAATIAPTPIPLIPSRSREQRALARLAARGHAGERVDEELDLLAASLYGISEKELAMLARFARRSTRRRKGPELLSSELRSSEESTSRSVEKPKSPRNGKSLYDR